MTGGLEKEDEPQAPLSTIGNYELIKYGILDFKRVLDTCFDSLGKVYEEVEFSQSALSDSEGIRAGGGGLVVDFSNMIQEVGKELISNVISSLNKSQAEVQSRFPRRLKYLSPLPNVPISSNKGITPNFLNTDVDVRRSSSDSRSCEQSILQATEVRAEELLPLEDIQISERCESTLSANGTEIDAFLTKSVNILLDEQGQLERERGESIPNYTQKERVEITVDLGTEICPKKQNELAGVQVAGIGECMTNSCENEASTNKISSVSEEPIEGYEESGPEQSPISVAMIATEFGGHDSQIRGTENDEMDVQIRVAEVAIHSPDPLTTEVRSEIASEPMDIDVDTGNETQGNKLNIIPEPVSPFVENEGLPESNCRRSLRKKKNSVEEQANEGFSTKDNYLSHEDFLPYSPGCRKYAPRYIYSEGVPRASPGTATDSNALPETDNVPLEDITSDETPIHEVDLSALAACPKIKSRSSVGMDMLSSDVLKLLKWDKVVIIKTDGKICPSISASGPSSAPTVEAIAQTSEVLDVAKMLNEVNEPSTPSSMLIEARTVPCVRQDDDTVSTSEQNSDQTKLISPLFEPETVAKISQDTHIVRPIKKKKQRPKGSELDNMLCQLEKFIKNGPRVRKVADPKPVAEPAKHVEEPGATQCEQKPRKRRIGEVDEWITEGCMDDQNDVPVSAEDIEPQNVDSENRVAVPLSTLALKVPTPLASPCQQSFLLSDPLPLDSDCDSDASDLVEVPPDSIKKRKVAKIISNPSKKPTAERPAYSTVYISSSDSDSDIDEGQDKNKTHNETAHTVALAVSPQSGDVENKETGNVPEQADDDDDCVIVKEVDTAPKPEALAAAAEAIREALANTPPNCRPPSAFSILRAKARANATAKAEEAVRRAAIARSHSSRSSYAGSTTPSLSRGRREIRPIIEAVTVETQIAGQSEQERVKRVEESQKLQESLVQEVQARGLVLEFDLTTKEPVVSVEKCLSDNFKKHQEEGVRFLWSACYGSAFVKTEAGCVLAHLMGLGKTLQALAFLHTVLSHQDLGTRTALILCPLATTSNWRSECDKWLSKTEVKIPIYSLYEIGKGKEEKVFRKWKAEGGIAILHYDAIVAFLEERTKDDDETSEQEAAPILSKKLVSLKVMEELLLNPGPDIVVCDEGHVLKNRKNKLHNTVSKFSTKRRIILTGTPIQNNLDEYYSMIQLVKPNLLGSHSEFSNGFRNPIENGLQADSRPDDVQLMKRRTYLLNEKLRGCVQRKDYGIFKEYLKPKHEYAIVVNLSSLQNDLYAEYIKTQCTEGDKLLPHYHILQKICCHPKLLYSSYSSRKKLKPSVEDSAKGAVLRDEGDDEEEEEEDLGAPDGTPHGAWYENILQTINRRQISAEWGRSGKLAVLKQIIEACAEIGDKLLIFSQFTYSLNVIEEFIKTSCSGDWQFAKNYFRIDGKTKQDVRHSYCENFNASPTAKLFLLTKGAGGLGINLHGANRVVLFDVSFNPSIDSQSIFRVYRLGQQKECYIYRLVSRGGMEEMTYRRSIIKLSLARRVVDEQQVERHFVASDTSNMYRFFPSDTSEISSQGKIPADSLLQNLLSANPEPDRWIHNLIEHDSLLMSEADNDLNEEEKMIAKNEVIRKPVSDKKRGKQKGGPKVSRPPPVPATVTPSPTLPIGPQPLITNMKRFMDIIFEEISAQQPDLRPNEIRDLITRVRIIFAEVVELRTRLNSGTVSEIERAIVEPRCNELEGILFGLINYETVLARVLNDPEINTPPLSFTNYTDVTPGPSRLCKTDPKTSRPRGRPRKPGNEKKVARPRKPRQPKKANNNNAGPGLSRP